MGSSHRIQEMLLPITSWKLMTVSYFFLALEVYTSRSYVMIIMICKRHKKGNTRLKFYVFELEYNVMYFMFNFTVSLQFLCELYNIFQGKGLKKKYILY